MKKLFTILCCAIVAFGLSSCNDDDDYTYVSVSGDGSLSIDGYPAHWLYRMVAVTSDGEQYTYLLGGTNSVTSAGNFIGRGAAVYYKYDVADTDALTTGTLTIGEDGIEAGYTTYIDYDRDDDDNDYVSIVSGSIQILKGLSGYHKIRILGVDSNGDNISIGYNGYIYAKITADSDNE